MKEIKEDKIEDAPMIIIEDHQLSQQGINNSEIIKDKGMEPKINLPKSLKIINPTTGKEASTKMNTEATKKNTGATETDLKIGIIIEKRKGIIEQAMVEIDKTSKQSNNKDSTMSLWRGNSQKQGTNTSPQDKVVGLQTKRSTNNGIKHKSLRINLSNLNHKKL